MRSSRENPFRSKAQARLFFAKEARGELPPGTAKRWMDETPDFEDLPEYVDSNPNDEDFLVIQMFYAEGPRYWEMGRLVEVQTFFGANSQLNMWGNSGRVEFVIYVYGEPVYQGTYDLVMQPADLKRQVMLYLDKLGTEDADRLLAILQLKTNPRDEPPTSHIFRGIEDDDDGLELEYGYVDPEGAWRPARLVEEDYPEAVVSETITEDLPTVEAINAALLAGTIGIGQSGIVTEVTEEHTRERAARRTTTQADLTPDMESIEQYLTERFGLALGPSADWISAAWLVEDAGDRKLYIVDQEEVDENEQPLFALVGRRLDESSDQYEDEVYFIGTIGQLNRMVEVAAWTGTLDRMASLAARSRAYIERARRDLGDLEGAELDLLADNTDGTLYELGQVLYILGERAEPAGEQETPGAGTEFLGAYGELPTTVLTEQFGPARPLPWNPATNGWFIGGNRWVQYRRQQDDGTPIYAVVEDDGDQTAVVFTGRVDEIMPWLQQNLIEEMQQEDPFARTGSGSRRISNSIDAESYIVDGEVDADGFEQWVNDAVGFLSERGARAQTDDFPTDPTVKVRYRSITSAVPEGEVFYRLHGMWRIEERAAVFKHRMASAGFMNRFRLYSAGVEDEGQRVQLFFGPTRDIRDIVITTWLAEVDNEFDINIVGFRLVNGDNGHEIMNGQAEVPQAGWNKGHRTVRKIMDLLGVRAVFVANGWPEEYYLNVGYEDNPFVYF